MQTSLRFDWIRRVLKSLSRIRLRHFAVDATFVVLSLYLSLLLRVGIHGFSEHLSIITTLLPFVLVCRLFVFASTKVYDIVWRYISFEDAVTVLRAVVLSSIVTVAATYFIDIGRFPRGAFLIDMVILSFMMIGARVFRRYLHETPSKTHLKQSGKHTLIFGAGSNGRTLANWLKTDTDIGYKIVGFMDDDREKLGRTVAGVRVLGTRSELADEIQLNRVVEVLIAISNPSGDLLREVVQACIPLNIRPRLIQGGQLSHHERVGMFREVELSDLLTRPKRSHEKKDIRNLIQGKRILITGAGGSIGSELSRQVHELNPQQLILLDHSELNLYQIDRKLRTPTDTSSKVSPCLCDIKDKVLLAKVFERYRPEIVFHAAAYKHVHLAQANPFSTILNNVLGTRNLVDAAQKFGVERFVMISTDKAVRPAGVMGETKRACEILVSAVGQQTNRRFTSVRFGNVLGSSGSLIPLLKEQIRKKQAITITDPQMKRFFMLIPEAVSLVFKAAVLSSPGDVMVLKMGDAVKIVDIAKSLMTLMGASETESPIVFTGLRPGEKLFEELYLSGDEISTNDPQILVVPKGDSAFGMNSPHVMQTVLDEIIEASANEDEKALNLLHKLAHGKLDLDLTPVEDRKKLVPSLGSQLTPVEA